MAEETVRRNLKRDSQPLGKTEILQLLLPDHEKIVLQYKADVKAAIDERLAGDCDADPYAAYTAIADELRAKAGQAGPSAALEEAKVITAEESKQKKPERKVLSQEQIVSQCLADLPWMSALGQPLSPASVMVKASARSFDKFQTALLHILSTLEGRAAPYAGLVDLFGNNEEVALAIVIQNCLQPKNTHRVEAIKAGSYVEIDSEETARTFLKNLLKKHLETELMAAESSVNAQLAELAQMHDVKALLEAPDVYVAAAALSTLKFYIGKGDRSAFFGIVLQTDPATIPDLGRKLKLVTQGSFMGCALFNDKLCSPERLSRTTIFRLWLHCARKNQVVSLEELIELQPHAKAWLLAYDKFVDAEGRTTLNQEEHASHRLQCKRAAEAKKKALMADRGNKLKMTAGTDSAPKKPKRHEIPGHLTTIIVPKPMVRLEIEDETHFPKLGV